MGVFSNIYRSIDRRVGGVLPGGAPRTTTPTPTVQYPAPAGPSPTTGVDNTTGVGMRVFVTTPASSGGGGGGGSSNFSGGGGSSPVAAPPQPSSSSIYVTGGSSTPVAAPVSATDVFKQQQQQLASKGAQLDSQAKAFENRWKNVVNIGQGVNYLNYQREYGDISRKIEDYNKDIQSYEQALQKAGYLGVSSMEGTSFYKPYTEVQTTVRQTPSQQFVAKLQERTVSRMEPVTQTRVQQIAAQVKPLFKSFVGFGPPGMPTFRAMGLTKKEYLFEPITPIVKAKEYIAKTPDYLLRPVISRDILTKPTYKLMNIKGPATAVKTVAEFIPETPFGIGLFAAAGPAYRALPVAGKIATEATFSVVGLKTALSPDLTLSQRIGGGVMTAGSIASPFLGTAKVAKAVKTKDNLSEGFAFKRLRELGIPVRFDTTSPARELKLDLRAKLLADKYGLTKARETMGFLKAQAVKVPERLGSVVSPVTSRISKTYTAVSGAVKPYVEPVISFPSSAKKDIGNILGQVRRFPGEFKQTAMREGWSLPRLSSERYPRLESLGKMVQERYKSMLVMIPRKGMLVPPRQGERAIDKLFYEPLGAVRRTLKTTAKFYKGKIKYRIDTSPFIKEARAFQKIQKLDKYGALGKGESFPMPRLTGMYPRYPRLELLGQLAQKGIGMGVTRLNQALAPKVRSIMASTFYYAPKGRVIQGAQFLGKKGQRLSDNAIMQADILRLRKGGLIGYPREGMGVLPKMKRKIRDSSLVENIGAIRKSTKRQFAELSVMPKVFTTRFKLRVEPYKRALFPSTTYSARLARLEKPIGFTAEPLMMPSSLNVAKPSTAERFVEVKSDKGNLLLLKQEPEKSPYYGAGQYEKQYERPEVDMFLTKLNAGAKSVFDTPDIKGKTSGGFDEMYQENTLLEPKTTNILVGKTSISLGQQGDIDLGQGGRFRQDISLGQKSGAAQGGGQKFDVGQKGAQRYDVLERVVSRTKQQERVIQRPRELQRTRQGLRYQERLVPRYKEPLRPKLRIPLITPSENKPLIPLTTKTARKPRQSFFVVTLKRKKPYLVTPKPLSRGQALSVGLSYTKRTERATFKLVPTTKRAVNIGVKPITEVEVYRAGYRPPVKKGKIGRANVFIQRKTTRMGTRPEVKAIQSYRRSTLW